jgi:hypothetical protein
MPNEEQARLVVHSSGGWPVGDTIDFLQTINTAYARLLTFETIIEAYESRARRFERYGWPFGLPPAEPGLWRDAVELPEASLERFIRPRDQLIVERVELSSPGFWAFLGNLNPLEVLRQYLNDRHTRQLEHGREPQNLRRLDLENQLLENQIISGRVAIARELGATDADLVPLLNSIIGPLQRLDALAERGMITDGNAQSTERAE